MERAKSSRLKCSFSDFANVQSMTMAVRTTRLWVYNWIFLLLLNFSLTVPVYGGAKLAETNGSLEVLIITPIVMSTRLYGGLPFVAPALESALKEVKREYPLLNVTQEYVIANDSLAQFGECGEQESDNQLAEYYYHRKRQPSHDGRIPWVLFILPGCSGSLYGIQQFANGLNKVVVTSGVSSRYQTDKINFPTLLNTVRAPPTSIAFYGTFLKLAQFYNWTTVGVVAEVGPASIAKSYETVGKLIYEILARATPLIQATYIPVSLTGRVSDSYLTALLERVKAHIRIYFLIADSLPANKFLIQARRSGMTDGSYVYVLTTSLTQPFEGSRLRNMSDEHRFQEARRSYPSCLLLDYGSNEKFEFSEAINGLHPLIDAWKAQSKREYNVTYPVSRQTVHAPAAYESVVVVAQMADQLRLRDPFDFNDGALLARQFFGKTFETKIDNITFDQLGQSVAEIAIGYYDLVEDNFVPFLKYERISDASEIRAIRKPRWEGGGWPVPSEPLCGFQGQRCAFGSSNTDAVVGGGLCLVALVILIIAFRVIWRRWATIRSEFWVLDDTYLLLPKTQHSNVS